MLHSLSPSARSAILNIARTAVAEEAADQPLATPAASPDLPDLDVSGLFVTLHVSGALRGCIGFLELQGTVEQTLREAAVRAATADIRFPPLEADELEDMTVDVTLLGPLEPLGDPTDFTIGLHGLVLEYAGRRGLLLPQVAVDHSWDKTQFLEGLCRKTMVPTDAWKLPGAVVSRFEGMVIKEEE